MTTNARWPSLGCGVGLRTEHYPTLLESWPAMDFFEAVSENFMDSEGRPLYVLEEVRKHYPVVLHGVSLSIGTTDELDTRYLAKLKALADRIEPAMVSDHLCWSSVDGHHLHDLLPLPFTPEALRHVVNRIHQVQEYLKRPFLIENVSSYITFKHSEITEWEFLSQIARRSGSGILLDINNIYVNSVNHGFDPYEYIRQIPVGTVGQFHLAGHTDMGKFLFDTHSGEVIEKVWDLYRFALKRFGQVSTLIEWDENIPEFKRLSEEALKARRIWDQALPQFPPVAEEALPEVAGTYDQKADADGLRKLQQRLKERLHPRAAGEGTRLEELLNPQGGDPGELRMDVYASGFRVRMREALAEAYPAIQSLLGPEAFRDLAQRYAEKFPSRHYNLSQSGRYLNSFLSNDVLSHIHPYLGDLAQLEWQVNQSFHASAVQPITADTIRQIPNEQWEHLVFGFQPGFYLLRLEWAVLDLWRKHRRQEKVKPGEKLIRQSQTLMIYRRDFAVVVEPVPEASYQVLSFLWVGKTLAEALGAVEDSEAPVMEWFGDWMAKGILTRALSSLSL